MRAVATADVISSLVRGVGRDVRAAATALVTSSLVRGRGRGRAAKAEDTAPGTSCPEVVEGGAVSQPA